MYPEKPQTLTRYTISERISDFTVDIDSQLKEKVASFVAFSVAIVESTNITNIALFAIFICEVDASLPVTEELVQFVPITGTTKGEDIFGSLVDALNNVGVDWTRAISVATHDAPSMTGRIIGVVAKLKEKVDTANGGLGFWIFHCIIHE